MPDINKHLEQFGRKQSANQRQTDVNIEIPITSLHTFDVVTVWRIRLVNTISLYVLWGGWRNTETVDLNRGLSLTLSNTKYLM